MPYTYELPKQSKSSKYTYELPEEREANFLERGAVGLGSNIAGFPSNVATGIGQVLEFTDKKVNQLGDYLGLPGERRETTQNFRVPGNTEHLRDLYAKGTGTNRESLNPQNELEEVLDFAGRELPQFALSGGLKGGQAAWNAAKTIGGMNIGSAIGGEIGSNFDEEGDETQGGRLIGSLIGGGVGAAAPHYIRPGFIKERGIAAAKKLWGDERSKEISNLTKEYQTTSKDLKKELVRNRKTAKTTRDQELATITKEQDKLHKEVQKGLEKGGKGLEETRALGQGVQGSTDKLKAIAQDVEGSLGLGIPESERKLILDTIKQVDEGIESGKLTNSGAQEFYQNLGKQRWGKSVSPEGNVVYRSPSDTSSIYQKKIQDVLSDYITESDPKIGKKWLKANERYSVAKELEKELKSKDYKDTIAQRQRDIELDYKQRLRDSESKIQNDLKESKKSYESNKGKLSKETYEDFVKNAEKKAVQDQSGWMEKHLPDFTYAGILTYLLGGGKGLGLLLKGGITYGRPLAKHALEAAKHIYKSPTIRSELHQAAKLALNGQVDAFREIVQGVSKKLS